MKPELLEDEKAAALSDAAWRLFLAAWLLSDDEGNFRASARYLAAQVWQDTTRDAEGPLQELAAGRFVLLYEADGQRYASIRTWRRHQVIDRPGKAHMPAPPAAVEEQRSGKDRGSSRETVASTRETVAPDPDRDRDLRPPTATASATSDRAHAHTRESESPRPEPGIPDLSPDRLELVAAIRRHVEFAGLDAQRAAESIEASQVAKPVPVGWLCQAIHDAASTVAASEAGGQTLPVVERAKLLAGYCRRAKAPPAASVSDAGPGASAGTKREPQGWRERDEALVASQKATADARATRDLRAQQLAKRRQTPGEEVPLARAGDLVGGVLERLKEPA